MNEGRCGFLFKVLLGQIDRLSCLDTDCAQVNHLEASLTRLPICRANNARETWLQKVSKLDMRHDVLDPTSTKNAKAQ